MAKKEKGLVEIFKKRTRHPFRPRASHIINKLFPDFKAIETTGGTLIAGSCNFKNSLLFVVAQQKPRPEDLQNSEDLNKLNYGMLTSDDHSVILGVLKEARKADPENTFVFTIIDTYGADISMYSAQRFQAFSLPISSVSS